MAKWVRRWNIWELNTNKIVLLDRVCLGEGLSRALFRVLIGQICFSEVA